MGNACFEGSTPQEEGGDIKPVGVVRHNAFAPPKALVDIVDQSLAEQKEQQERPPGRHNTKGSSPVKFGRTQSCPHPDSGLHVEDDLKPSLNTKSTMSTMDVQLTSTLDVAKACCLAWMLGLQAHASTSEEELFSFQEHIVTWVQLLGAEVLAAEATCGIIRGHPREDDSMSEADVAVRIGQLLCRWGMSHKMPIRVGVHVGRLRCMNLPAGISPEGKPVLSHFGAVCAEAKHLAASAEQELVVHISKEAKARLQALRLVRLQISSTHESYYLDPATAVTNTNDLRMTKFPSSATSERTADEERLLAASWNGKLTLEEFRTLLTSYGIDLSKFGYGDATTIEAFYGLVVQEQKAHLFVANNGLLEREVHLVRISLCVQVGDGQVLELRLASQQAANGAVRVRNRKLSMALKYSERSRWRDFVASCIETKLGVSAAVQRSCLDVDEGSVVVNEERWVSASVPGMMTLYKCNDVVVNIRDFKKMGLPAPAGQDFTTAEGADGTCHWTWKPASSRTEQELLWLLQLHNIVSSEFTSQAMAELHEEVYEAKGSLLEVKGGELLRTIRIIKVWLVAKVVTVDHVLVLKTKCRNGRYNAAGEDRAITMRIHAEQGWLDAVQQVLITRVGISSALQAEALEIDTSSYRVHEEIGYSQSYPGLKTLYEVHEVRALVRDSSEVRLCGIGLPSGTDFTYARPGNRTAKAGCKASADGSDAKDVIITRWCWKLAEEIERQRAARVKNSLERSDAIGFDGRDESLDTPAVTRHETIHEGLRCTDEAEVGASRVPDPKPMLVEKQKSGPVAALAGAMKGKETDWSRARRAAERIRDPDYGLREYHDDIAAAFPELGLYCAVAEGAEQTTSGRSSADEYQRTIGALFVVYWLMRLDIDGRESICFGVNGSWKPKWRQRRNSSSPSPRGEHTLHRSNALDVDDLETRKAFFDKADWIGFQNLVVDAGLLVCAEGQEGELSHDPDRTLAMLVLMAIHDIMKMSVLLPSVDRKHGAFAGHKPGEVIHDHDIALSYVLQYFPDLLPSFSGLPKPQQDSIRFTHCKLDYNMGWLVQGEAPPGPLFRTFRQVVQSGSFKPADIAFYFVHWFVDLAGAEPCPLEGAVKFVLKFPLKVLTMFFESFSVVQNLGTSKSETQVFEQYLLSRWESLRSLQGSPPMGAGSIAKMRLVIMAQGNSQAVLSAFDRLSAEDKATLSEEMAITGCRSQAYERDAVKAGSGPALLVYYAPALMQKAGKKDPAGALAVLAEVFRRARALIPLSAKDVDGSVIVRIDALKELETGAILRPDARCSWVVSKSGNQDLVVKLVPKDSLRDIDWSMHQNLTFHEDRHQQDSLKLKGHGFPRPQVSGALPSLRKRFAHMRVPLKTQGG